MIPLNDQQRLFFVETEQIYSPWQLAKAKLASYQHGMTWKKVGGREYLYRLTDSWGNAKSQGVRSSTTEAMFEAFQTGRKSAQERFHALNERMEQQARLNKAVRINRLPGPVASILQALDNSPARQQFRVIGTHALYAYEALAGVQLRMELLASGDVDLLYDPRTKLSLTAKHLGHQGLLGLLRRADKTFEKIADSPFRAINNAGFMVDLIIPPVDMRDKTIVTFSTEDLIAAEVPNLQWLTNAPAVEVVVIGSNGFPVRMKAPDPRAFLLHKAWLSTQVERDPVKKPRDHHQALCVLEMLQTYLPQYAIDVSRLRFFQQEALTLAQRTLGLA